MMPTTSLFTGFKIFGNLEWVMRSLRSAQTEMKRGLHKSDIDTSRRTMEAGNGLALRSRL